MTVYVDRCKLRFKNMLMCHMIADTMEELLDMADKLELKSEWLQNADTYRAHFDISQSKRVQAIVHGAQEITLSKFAEILNRKREAALNKGPKNPKYK